MFNSLKIMLAIVLVSTIVVVVFHNAEAQSVMCSQEDEQLILLYYQSVVEATMAGNLQLISHLSQELQEALSPECWAALVLYSQSQPYSGGSGYLSPPPSVYDHGGGTYSVPGVGACGPGGCVPY